MECKYWNGGYYNNLKLTSKVVYLDKYVKMHSDVISMKIYRSKSCDYLVK